MTKKELLSGLEKFEIIAPLLSCGLEPAAKRRLKNEIMARHGIAGRTLRRYLQQYREQGYDGMIRPKRQDEGTSKAIEPGVLEAAIELRQELPGRSARRIIEILEAEGLCEKGKIARSTLNRQLAKAGATRDDVKQSQPARRFQKQGRNALWQADIKYGPYVPGKNGKKIRTYLMVIIDDATRMIIHAEFYDNQKLPILEDSFRKGLLKFGVPDAVYVDNGKVFISKWFRLACARLGVNHIATQPYSPQSKGKVERFNGLVNEFLEELALEPPKTLAELNLKFRHWLEEGYLHRPHSGLEGKSPHTAYQENPKHVRFTSSSECRDVFLWEETRKVDRTGTVKLEGHKYDAGVDLINKKVDLRFDPFDLSVVEIWANGMFVRKAQELVIGEYLPKTPTPEPTKPSEKSRLLSAYADKYALRERQKNGAIAFADIHMGGESNV